MTVKSDVEKFDHELNALINKYSNSSDPEIREIILNLKREHKNAMALRGVNAGFKLAIIADKIRDLIDWLSNISN